jgi:Ca2+-binding RTX toxin-like protein
LDHDDLNGLTLINGTQWPDDQFQFIRILGGAGNDTDNLLSTVKPVQLEGRGGLDAIFVGNNLRGVQDIRADLNLGNDAGLYALNVDDAADLLPRNPILVDVGPDLAIQNLAPALIQFRPTQLLALDILAGQNNDLFIVVTTPVAKTTIQLGPGDDTVVVFNPIGLLNLDGGPGNNTLISGGAAPGIWILLNVNQGFLIRSIISFQAFGDLVGSAGDDIFIFADGAQVTGSISGGGGTNTLDYTAYSSSLLVVLPIGLATGVEGGISGIHNVTGGSSDDVLVGDGGANVLLGNGGRDVLIGGGGPDLLDGGADEDLLIDGTTEYDANPDGALAGIGAAWASVGTPYEERICILQTDYLLTDKTVHHDSDSDVLIGGADALDWFWGRTPAMGGKGVDEMDREPALEHLNVWPDC